MTRYVRRACLRGEGAIDRKEWIEHRLEELAQVFGHRAKAARSRGHGWTVLCKRQAEKLIPAREATWTTIASIPPNAGVEVVPRDEVHELSEHEFSGFHRSCSTLGKDSSGLDCDQWKRYRSRSLFEVNPLRIINHGQRPWYWEGPPEGAVYVRLPPLGAWSWSGPGFSQAPTEASPLMTNSRLIQCHARVLPSPDQNGKSTPDRSKLFGSHGQRPWF